jgi:hypothetical protein
MKESIKLNGKVSVDVIRADGRIEQICKEKDNLLTTAGRDWVHSRLYTNIASYAVYIGLSTNSTIPAIGDIVLTDEITTGGLERAAGTVTHVAGSSTSTITKTFASSAIFTGLQKVGLFSAISGGTLVHENNFQAFNLADGDQIQVTWTITVS